MAAEHARWGPLSRALSWFGHREFPVLLAMFLVMASVWLFVEIADDVFEGDTHEYDRAILLAMRSPENPADPRGPGWVEELGRDITALGGVGVLVLITAAVVGYLLLQRRRRTALLVVLATSGGLVLSTALKFAFERARPDLVPHGSIVYTASFPSGHSMMAAATYLTLGALLARTERHWRMKAYLLLVAIVLTVLVGISRVYLGVHWPTDVLAGWTAGAGWALLWWLVVRHLQRRGQVEREEFTAPDTD